MSILLGITWAKNATAAIYQNGEIIACCSEERFSRVKNDERYPINAINYLLTNNNIKPKDLDGVIFVSTMFGPGYVMTRRYTKFDIKDYIDEQYKIWKPKIFFGEEKSHIEEYINRVDFEQYPGKVFWTNVREKLINDSGHPSSKKSTVIGQEIRKDIVMKHLGINKEKVFFADHSLSHACYAYYSTPERYRKSKNLVITLDAFGDNVNYSASIFKKDKNLVTREIVSEGNDFIIARLYRYITLLLGLKPDEHEYKVMGMAPYCKEKYYKNLLSKFMKMQVVNDINFEYINKPRDLYFSIKDMIDGERFDTISGAVQAYSEYLITTWVKNLIDKFKIDSISIAGGVGMNVKANMLIAKLPQVKYLYVPPTPDDTSQAIGALFAHIHNNQVNKKDKIKSFQSPYLGREEIINKSELKKYLENINVNAKVKIKKYNSKDIAKEIFKGKVVASYFGKEEFGARALGNRSILANPSSSTVKKKINEKIKNRDFWMPFACSISSKYCEKYINLDTHKSSYQFMTICTETTKIGADLLKAGIHPYDETCRPQIVYKSSNKKYFELIEDFGKISGVYALLNTSFNLHGYPIVSSVRDAISVFFKSNLDILILNEIVIKK